ncbi:MAG: hypothetical protein M3Y37_00365, partial [Chloroflexota bacterium]|nr:hypothetical protein [Chloroflexota bacterium]
MEDRSAGDRALEREEWLTLEEAAEALRIDAGELAEAVGNGSSNGRFADHLIYRHGSQIRIHRSIAFPNGHEQLVADLRAEIQSLGLAVHSLSDEVRHLKAATTPPPLDLGPTIPLTLN